MTQVLGITGGIAAGKSSVAALFAECGAEVVSADRLAREVVAPGSVLLAQLAATFGGKILTAAGELDRAALAGIVFADPAARQRLNAMIHPEIARQAQERLQVLRAHGVPLVVYEAPLLFEAGAAERVDLILVVVVAPAIQQERLTLRDGLTASAVGERINAQWPQSAKVARADFVIDNSGSLEETRRQVAALHDYLLSARHRRSLS